VTIDPVRGMRDVGPADYAAAAAVRQRLLRVIAEYGYQLIDLPVVEPRALYLRKLGEELVGKVYEFTFGGRDLALRPEWTASVLRAYVAAMQDQPLPLRLAYSGPVFRYERPQRHTYRQFTQVGGEILGGPAPRADAEAVALAVAGLTAADVSGFQLRLGHIGLARELTARFALPDRMRGRLIWSLERLRADGRDAVLERLRADLGHAPEGLQLPAGLDDAQATLWLAGVLQAMRIDLNTGTRSSADVLSRLLRSLRRADELPLIAEALDLLSRLAALRGPAAEVLPALQALLGTESPAARELAAIVDLLAAQGIDGALVEIDGALGRGLHYYTGLVFEITHPAAGQLCGGGRYDDLVAALGGRSIPAVGFAYGLERVVAAAGQSAPPELPPVFVAAVSDAEYGYALQVAAALRAAGRPAVVDLRGRSLAANLRDAVRRGCSAAAIVGAEEAATRCVVWRDLREHREQRLPFDRLADAPR
jgi:histidyl-tRNA synthetase